jgi:hypothetical protein
MGANGQSLGTVEGTDAQGNVTVKTSSGVAANLPPGVISDSGGQLTASTVSRQDLMAMAATQQGDQQAAAHASTRTAAHHSRRHHHRYAGSHPSSVPTSATTDTGTQTDVNGAVGTPQTQPAAPEMPATGQQPTQPEQQQPAQPEQQQPQTQPH